jgi:hypothetical protein
MKGQIINSLCLIFTLSAFSIPIGDHAIYIGVIGIEHNVASKQSKLQFKIFSDDLHDAIRLEYQAKDPIDSMHTIDYQVYIQDYLNQHFRMSIDNQPITINNIESHKEGEALFVETIVITPMEWHVIEISTDILLDIFPTQQNIVQLNNCGHKRFAKLSKNETGVVFQF